MDFAPEPKYLKIGKRKYDVTRISAKRVLTAVRVYNTAITKEAKTDLETTENLLDAVMILVRIDFSFARIIDWARRRILTKSYILKTVSYKELSDFMQIALEPILGDKKKEMEQRGKLMEVEQELLKKFDPKELARLLGNLLQSTDGLLNTSSKR